MALVGHHDLILGLPWCQYHSVQFDWVNRNISQWSPECEGRCFHTQVAPLHVRRLCPDAIAPRRATEGAVGYDLHAVTLVTIPPAARTLVPTGISIETPDNMYGRVAPRSGLATKTGIDISAGVIDPDYRGEVKVLMINNGSEPHEVQPGDRIAQLILEGAQTPLVIVTDNLSATVRGQAGFGSTGMTPELAEIFEVTLGHAASTKLAPQDIQYAELRKQVPSEYHNYLDVFDTNLAMSACPLTAQTTTLRSTSRKTPSCPHHTDPTS